MAATLTQERFTGADWTFERKYDGIRLLALHQLADFIRQLIGEPVDQRSGIIGSELLKEAADIHDGT